MHTCIQINWAYVNVTLLQWFLMSQNILRCSFIKYIKIQYIKYFIVILFFCVQNKFISLKYAIFVESW